MALGISLPADLCISTAFLVGSGLTVGSPAMAPKNILVVEDDESIREALGDLFQIEGYAVRLAENGLEALHALEDSNALPSLILLDLMMPVMDGRTFLKELAKRDYPAIPICVLTAGSKGEFPPTTESFQILRKPINVDDLMSNVETLTRPRAS